MSGFAGLWLAVPDTPAVWLADAVRLLAHDADPPEHPLTDDEAAAILQPPDDTIRLVDEPDRWAGAASGFGAAVQGADVVGVMGPAGRVLLAVAGWPFDRDPHASTTSDATPESLAAIAESAGVDAMLSRWPEGAAGIVFDRERRRVWLLRDANGRWPLYYGWLPGIFVASHGLRAFERFTRAFGPSGHYAKHSAWLASAFRRLGQWTPEVNRGALAHIVRYGHVAWPFTIHRDVFALPPGALITLSPADVAARPHHFSPWPTGPDAPGLHPREWSRLFHDLHGMDAVDAAADRLSSLLDRYLDRHDDGGERAVAFSGGLDSSLIAHRLARRARGRTRLFTVGFADKTFDETEPAAAFARALDLPHEVVRIDDGALPGLAAALANVYEQPYGNPSAVPTLAMMRQVAATGSRTLYLGDGADEALAGYRRHWDLPRWWRMFGAVPWGLRRAISALAGLVPADWLASMLAKRWPVEFGRQGAEGLWLRSTAAMAAWDALDFRRRFSALGFDPRKVLTPDPELGNETPLMLRPPPPISASVRAAVKPGFPFEIWFRMFLEFDRAHGLPDDGLMKVTAPARMNGLAARLPFAEPALMRLGRACPVDILRAPKGPGIGPGKQPMRALLEREAPGESWNRPKRGFAAPVGAWLRGPLREWADALLNGRRLDESGWWDPGPILRAWRRHTLGQADAGLRLWPILMIEHWRKPL